MTIKAMQKNEDCELLSDTKMVVEQVDNVDLNGVFNHSIDGMVFRDMEAIISTISR
jgi:hypothetical protein